MKTLKTLALIGLLAIFAAIVAGVFFFGGFYMGFAADGRSAQVDRHTTGHGRQPVFLFSRRGRHLNLECTIDGSSSSRPD